MKTRIAALLSAAFMSLLASPVLAEPENLEADAPKLTYTGSDFTGLWFNTAESGWGVNFIQQGPTIFATLFIYGTDNRPVWLVAPGMVLSGGVFSGSLLLTSGPSYTGAFNPSQVGNVPVGTMTLRPTASNAAQLVYTVNGATYTKNIVPQTWTVNNLSGTYIGAMYGATANCNAPIPQAAASLLAFSINHNTTSNAVTMSIANTTGNRCTITGTVTQYGKQSLISGTQSCDGGAAEAVAIAQLEAGIFGLAGFYLRASVGACSATATTIGAARVS